VGKIKIIDQETVGLVRGHKFGWEAFWGFEPRWVLFKVKFRQYRGEIRHLSVAPYLGIMRALPRFYVLYLGIYLAA
jgi:hypothetical protein